MRNDTRTTTVDAAAAFEARHGAWWPDDHDRPDAGDLAMDADARADQRRDDAARAAGRFVPSLWDVLDAIGITETLLRDGLVSVADTVAPLTHRLDGPTTSDLDRVTRLLHQHEVAAHDGHLWIRPLTNSAP